MALLNQLLETCTTLTKKVGDLEQDKIAQAIEITKLKQRVRRLEKKKKLKASGLKRLRNVGTVTPLFVKKTSRHNLGVISKHSKFDGKADEGFLVGYSISSKAFRVNFLENQPNVVGSSPAWLFDIDTLTQSMSYQTVSTGSKDPQNTDADATFKVKEPKRMHLNRGKLLNWMQIRMSLWRKLMLKFRRVTTATTLIIAAPIPKASAPRRRRSVIIHDHEEAATASLSIQSEIEHDEAFVRELEAELNANINWNEVIEQVKRKEKQDNTVMRYQALKRKPVTKAHVRKNMMVYLKNMAGFKMDFFKEEESKLSKRNGENLEQEAAKKQKIDEEVEELKTHLQIVSNDEDDVYTEATPLYLKVPVVDYQIYTEHNKPYYKIIRSYGTHQLFLSFISLLRNFDKEDLEMLWKIIQERFAFSEPKNFLNDFLLNTFKTMFEKPNVEASIRRNQSARYGLAKVRSWKLLESCGVHIITLTTT
uniref:Uncharacterized protein n=1 Tax=Tanacetum cinerariifolium TaxID=118510 RepID=A0A6L2LPQ2_TANCI|nr:hypothetical protein [Tanacetum cinerariifolium]